MSEVLKLARDARGVVRLTLNRPDAHNALSPELTEALERAVDTLARDTALRVLVVTGAGASFCGLP